MDLIERQAAIDAICDNCDTVEASCPHYPCSRYVAVEKLPSVERDYNFHEWCTECKEYDKEKHCCPRFNQVIRTTLQEVQEEWKKGHWVDRFGLAQCSECNMEFMYKYKFCPNCGSYNGGDDNVNE